MVKTWHCNCVTVLGHTGVVNGWLPFASKHGIGWSRPTTSFNRNANFILC